MITIEALPYDFTVCRVADFSLVDPDTSFCFLAKTDEEASLVCRTADVPANVIVREDGWRAMRIAGVLDFSLVGILSRLTGILAENAIPVFAVSTFNTDYLLTKREDFPRALSLLDEGENDAGAS